MFAKQKTNIPLPNVNSSFINMNEGYYQSCQHKRVISITAATHHYQEDDKKLLGGNLGKHTHVNNVLFKHTLCC